jgi:hypothetical protein
MNSNHEGRTNMKRKAPIYFATKLFTFILAGFSLRTSAQVTPADGDWSRQFVVLTNTPEAAIMVRAGDVDNLGFGWPGCFDPFSGQSGPEHGWPWSTDPLMRTGPTGSLQHNRIYSV